MMPDQAITMDQAKARIGPNDVAPALARISRYFELVDAQQDRHLGSAVGGLNGRLESTRARVGEPFGKTDDCRL
jgi:hypothetical protein